MAATFDPGRRFGGVVALGHIGDPSSRPLLRNLVEDPDPMMRAAAAAALYRCGERDGQLFSDWLSREGAMVVFAFPAAPGRRPARRGARETRTSIESPTAWA